MALCVQELKSVCALLSRARIFIGDALTVAENGNDVAVTARVKTLLFRAKDMEREMEARLAAAEREEEGGKQGC